MRIFLAVVVVLCFAGCGPARQTARENNALANYYQEQMEQGKTTTEQDKNFIRASAKGWYEMDAALRGRKDADATKVQAKAMASPIKLDDKK